MESKKFSLCILLFGDYYDLAVRCLNSITNSYPSAAHVSDIRIGLNNVSGRVRNFVTDWLSGITWSLGVQYCVYTPVQKDILTPAFKYPLMRRMLHDPNLQLADFVMWFDDDTYINTSVIAGEEVTNDTWWRRTRIVAHEADMMGQLWWQPINDNVRRWIMSQSWYTGRDIGNKLRFVQGAWWVIKSEIIKRYNWPIPELRHCGGDSLLGELLRQQGYNLTKYDYRLRINADENGKHSGAARRGFTEPNLGYAFDGVPLSTEHQKFDTLCTDMNYTTKYILGEL